MKSGRFRFEPFLLDLRDRRLMRGDAPVELNGRYLDALALLVGEAGKLVSKDRFFDEVWKGVPVTDEALTQCIKTLRRQLGDKAADPRFIETVPKHGYRFIAPVTGIDDEAEIPAARPERSPPDSWRSFFLTGGGGTIGGGIAGIFGGLFYGLAGAFQPLQPGTSGSSALLVLLCVNILVGLIGGAGVGFGIAAAGIASGRSRPWTMIGGACGGLLVGAFAKLLGLDAFNLLLGRSPGDITGAAEGALLGGAIGLGIWIGRSGPGRLRPGRSIAATCLCSGIAGILIPLLGGRLMGGSLDLVARAFPDSRLRLDPIGGLFGENGFGTVSQIVTGVIEGLVFGGCVAGAMLIARRRERLNRDSI